MSKYNLNDLDSLKTFGDRIDKLLSVSRDHPEYENVKEELIKLTRRHMPIIIEKLRGILKWKEKVLDDLNE